MMHECTNEPTLVRINVFFSVIGLTFYFISYLFKESFKFIIHLRGQWFDFVKRPFHTDH